MIKELHEQFEYFPISGNLVWKARKGNDAGTLSFNARFAGKVAGSINNQGYRDIKVGSIRAKVHRIAWAMSYGYWPTEVIDQINRCRDDNRLSNLRHVTQKENCANRGGQFEVKS